MEISTKVINSYREIGSECVQVKVDNDCIVPDVKPDVSEIVMAASSITEISARPYTDRVVLSGQVTYKVIYVDENGGYDSISVPADFTTTVWLQGATADSTCLVKGGTTNTECRILNSRKLNIKTGITLCVDIVGMEEVSVFCPTKDDQDMEIVTGQTEVLSHQGNLHFSKDMSANLEMTSGGELIAKVLYFDLSPRDMYLEVDYDRITVNGVMDISAVYMTQEGASLQTVSKQVPFEVVGDVAGLTPDSQVRINPYFVSPYAQILNDEDGEPSILELGVTLCVDGVVGLPEKVEYIRSGYSKSTPVKEERKIQGFVAGLWNNRETVSFSDELVMPERQIGEVLGVWAHTDNICASTTENSVNITGNVHVKVLYTEQGTGRLTGECFVLPISLAGEVPTGGTMCHVSAVVCNLTWTVNSPMKLGIKYSLTCDMSLCHRESISEVCQFVPSNEGFPSNFSCGMVVYYPEPGETAWDVAGKYMISVQELMELNGMEDDVLPTRIFLPGK